MRNGWISSINQKQKHMIQIHVKVHIFSVEVIRHVFYKIKIMTRILSLNTEKCLNNKRKNFFRHLLNLNAELFIKHICIWANK